MMGQRFGSLMALALVGFAAPAYAQTKLEWKLQEGDKFYLETVTTTKFKTKLMDQDQPTKQDVENKTIDRVEVMKKSGQEIVFKKTTESVKLKNKGEEINDPKEPAKRLEGAVLLITLNPSLKTVTKVEGVDEFIKKTFGAEAFYRTRKMSAGTWKTFFPSTCPASRLPLMRAGSETRVHRLDRWEPSQPRDNTRIKARR
jgi:hypothetical protein